MRLDTPSIIFSTLAGLSSALIAHGYYAPAALAGFVAMAVLADVVVVRLADERATRASSTMMAMPGPLGS